MKKLFVVLCIIGIAATCYGSDFAKTPVNSDTVIKINDKDSKPVKIVTRTNTIWVWPCGQVGREGVEIIHENEEIGAFTSSSIFWEPDDNSITYTVE